MDEAMVDGKKEIDKKECQAVAMLIDTLGVDDCFDNLNQRDELIDTLFQGPSDSLICSLPECEGRNKLLELIKQIPAKFSTKGLQEWKDRKPSLDVRAEQQSLEKDICEAISRCNPDRHHTEKRGPLIQKSGGDQH